ncbi:MAG: FAD-binding and (Fe-S)-binding domain-containing protein, partial [Burkholderiaceae bacterium]
AEIYRSLVALRDRYAEEMRARFPQIPRRVSGYNIEALLPENGFHVARSLVGSEGTCVVILEAKVRLVPNPKERALLVLGYNDVYAAGDHVPEVMQQKPIAVEGIDDRLIEDVKAMQLHPEDTKLFPQGNGWLIVEFGGDTRDEARASAERAKQAIQRSEGNNDAPSAKVYDDPAMQKKIWRVRESSLGATAHVPNKPVTWEGWEDSAVAPARLGEYLRKLRALLEKYDYECSLYGHFGQGCVHVRIDFDLETAAGIAKYREFVYEAAHLVVSLDGTISGEHGDGQSKGELLPIMFGEQLMQAFREFKAIWDPDGKMNPGKLIDANPMTEDLRLGTGYSPPVLQTQFHYTGDGGNFSRALLRCVGVGECRKKSGTMCPSYMATGEEMHSTRGRARLLFEMQRGETIHGGWKDDHVHEALELCLSCKGCKGECPVKVDMATYKAEFMSHYYEGRMRPLEAYAFGYIDRWARIASHAPKVANFFTQTQPFAGIAKKLAQIAPQRRITAFAHEPFVTSFKRRPTRRVDDTMQRVLLWPDTFNNYFHPQVAQAAVDVLERTGCTVGIPASHLCCGRPLYEFGFIDSARDYLRRVMQTLEADIRAGTPIIGLEPACVSVFRDELPNLFPADVQALRLSKQVVLLSEFLQDRLEPLGAKLDRRAIVQAHCHHKSVLKTDALESLLRALGLDYQLLDSGCCGMAGSFGFAKAKYDVSMRCAERVLLPAVRNADEDTLIIADGFSCREQIEQTTKRRALHPAEVIGMAIDGKASSKVFPIT